MKRSSTIFFTIVVVAILVGAGYLLLSERSSKDEDAVNTTVNTAVNTNVNTSIDNTNSAAANTNTSVNGNIAQNTNTVSSTAITVTTDGFSPKSLTVAVGTTVVWTNTTGQQVYIAPDDHPTHTKYAGIWDDTGAGNIADGETYSFTFTKAGTYTYHDHLNPEATGTVIVQ